MFRIKREYDAATNTLTTDFIGTLPEKYKNAFENFYTYYEVEDLILDVEDSRRKLKKRSERTCRFCNKSVPEASFKNTSHLVPSMMGNRYLLSDFECDACNSLFSGYENDLANYLGVERSFNPLKKGKVVRFETPDKKLRITEGFLDENDKVVKTHIQSLDPNKNHFTLDEEKKQIILRSTKHP
jgi:hypothetical protein